MPAPDAVDRGVTPRWAGEPANIGKIVLALDGSEFAERALPAAEAIGRLFDATLNLVSVLPARAALRVLPKGCSGGDPLEAGQVETETYLVPVAGRAKACGIRIETYVASGPVAQALDMLTRELDAEPAGDVHSRPFGCQPLYVGQQRQRNDPAGDVAGPSAASAGAGCR